MNSPKKRTKGNGVSPVNPYFTHCIATANVLTELKLDVRTICAGLLHDVIEDTPVTRDETRKPVRRNNRSVGAGS